MLGIELRRALEEHERFPRSEFIERRAGLEQSASRIGPKRHERRARRTRGAFVVSHARSRRANLVIEGARLRRAHDGFVEARQSLAHPLDLLARRVSLALEPQTLAVDEQLERG